MGNAVVHFELGGQNGGELQSFYAEQFGWKIDASNPMQYGMVDTGSKSGIGGGISAAQPDGPQAWCTFYIEVSDVDRALASVEGAGGKIVVPKTVIPNMVTFAQFADPAGNVVGLVLAQPAPEPVKKKAPKKRAKKKAPKKKAPKKKASKKKASKKKPGKKKSGKKKGGKSKKRSARKGKRKR